MEVNTATRDLILGAAFIVMCLYVLADVLIKLRRLFQRPEVVARTTEVVESRPTRYMPASESRRAAVSLGDAPPPARPAPPVASATAPAVLDGQALSPFMRSLMQEIHPEWFDKTLVMRDGDSRTETVTVMVPATVEEERAPAMSDEQVLYQQFVDDPPAMTANQNEQLRVKMEAKYGVKLVPYFGKEPANGNGHHEPEVAVSKPKPTPVAMSALEREENVKVMLASLKSKVKAKPRKVIHRKPKAPAAPEQEE